MKYSKANHANTGNGTFSKNFLPLFLLLWLGSLGILYILSIFFFTHNIMASLFRLFTLFFFVVVICNFLLLPNAVLCDETDDKILNAINKYRHSKNLSDLIQNSNAACLASRLVFRLRNEPCSSPDDFNKDVSSETKLSDFHKLLSKCHIDYNSSVDGIILPACIPKLEPEFVVRNFTHSHDVNYLNDGSYAGAGVGTIDNWVVIILSTNTSTGNFTNGGSSLVLAGGGCIGMMMPVLLGLFASLLVR